MIHLHIQVKQVLSRHWRTLTSSMSPDYGNLSLRESFRRRQSSIMTTSVKTEHTGVEEDVL